MINVERFSVEKVDFYRHDIIQLINETLISNFPNSVIQEEYYNKLIDDLHVYMKKGNAMVFVALEDDVLLGWLWCHPIVRFDCRRMHIAFFAVKKDVREKGIGHKLYEVAEEYASQQGCSGIDLLVTKENAAAVKFYEKHGFEVERYLMKKEKNDFKDSGINK